MKNIASYLMGIAFTFSSVAVAQVPTVIQPKHPEITPIVEAIKNGQEKLVFGDDDSLNGKFKVINDLTRALVKLELYEESEKLNITFDSYLKAKEYTSKIENLIHNFDPLEIPECDVMFEAADIKFRLNLLANAIVGHRSSYENDSDYDKKVAEAS